MNESDTPRTDAQATGNSDPQQDEYEDLLWVTRTLERELTAARAELAELKEEYGTWWAQKRIALDELKEVIEQRDRLAEAGKDLLKNLYNINDDGGKIATIRRMKEALQSLTLNKL